MGKPRVKIIIFFMASRHEDQVLVQPVKTRYRLEKEDWKEKNAHDLKLSKIGGSEKVQRHSVDYRKRENVARTNVSTSI